MKRFRLVTAPPSPDQLQQVFAERAGNPTMPAESEDSIRAKLTLHYKTLVQITLRTPLDPQGITIEEMEKSLGILNLVNAIQDGDVLELEDADHAYLVQKLAAVRWSSFDDRILTFVHALRNATQDVADLPGDPSPIPPPPPQPA